MNQAPKLDGAPHSIALALSGGGHRATLFTLGALMYVVDAGRARDTTSIASVSGGSLTNGFLGQTLDFQNVNSPGFEERVVAPLAGQIAQRGTLFAPLLTKLYAAGLAVGLVAAFLPLWLVPEGWGTRHLIVLGLLFAWGWLLGLRGKICAHALKKTLFSPDGKVTPLSGIGTKVSHILCATELRTAESVYFAGDFVYAFAFGPGTPAALPLYRAVQASAAFPGGFPPARLPTRTHEFAGPLGGSAPAPSVRDFVLSDGGVYDNMGDEWARSFSERAHLWKWLAETKVAPKQLVVINASARIPWVPFRWGRVPLLGEILALLRVSDVMYVNTTNVRRQDIVRSFDPLTPDRTGALPAALVQIAQTPFGVADQFARAVGHPVAQRAESVIRALGPGNRESWREIASQNSSVATTLAKLGTTVSARLLYQGYVVAMCNLHVIFGSDDGPQGDWPLLAIPSLDRFLALVS